jgi:serine/threonine-protein kinase
MRLAVSGGPPRTIAVIDAPNPRGAAWGIDDTIVFGTDTSSGLWRVPADGGAPEPLTTLDSARGELNHEWPSFLPDGNGLLFAIRRQGQVDDASEIVVRDLASGIQRTLVAGGSTPRYAPSGHLVYATAGTLWAVPFDLDARAVRGNRVAVEADVRTRFSGAADYALAAGGTLVYVKGDVQGAVTARHLVWVSASGREAPVPTPPRAFESVSLSPDGVRAALGTGAPDGEVWISDLARGTLQPVSLESGGTGSPLWSPDGRRVVFATNRRGWWEVVWQAADGSGDPETLVAFDDPLVTRVVPGAWSPDGEQLLVAVGPGEQALDIGVVSIGDPGSWRYLLQTPAGERNPAVSPDGRWLAYGSNQSGAYEVYVERFPDGGGRQQVSVGGGHTPRWSSDGTSLTYVRALAPGNPVAMTRVTVVDDGRPASRPIFGTPEDLFPYNYFGVPGGQWWFDMTLDGERFLMIEGDTNVAIDPPPVQLVVVQDWFTALERLAPTD